VRGMAAWALSRLMDAGEFERFAAGRVEDADDDVRAEYERAKADAR
jgi:epoxyqueuosine reductase